MRTFLTLCVLVLVSSSVSKPAPEESVVSVYTTEPNTGNFSVDVYRQIANNLAERIAAPFHRFFNREKNKTETELTKKHSSGWENLELLDEPATTKFNTDDNEILVRDTEELSDEALNRKQDKKPEKISLNRYLPVNQHLEEPPQTNNTDDFKDITLDDVEPAGREGPFIFLLELLGSFFQLMYGAISAWFSRPNPSTGEDPN